MAGASSGRTKTQFLIWKNALVVASLALLIFNVVFASAAKPSNDLVNVKLEVQGGHGRFVSAIYEVEGTNFFASIGRESSIKFWDRATGFLMKTLYLPDFLQDVRQLSTNIIVVADSSSLHVVDIHQRSILSTHKPAVGNIWRIVALPKMNSVLIVTLDKKESIDFFEYSLGTSSVTNTFELPGDHVSFVTCLEIAQDGDTFLIGGRKGRFMSASLSQQKIVAEFDDKQQGLTNCILAASGKMAAAFATNDEARRPIKIRDLSTGKVISHPVLADIPNVIATALSADEKLLAWADEMGRLSLYSLDRKRNVAQIELGLSNPRQITALNFSGDGNLVMIGNVSGKLWEWDWKTNAVKEYGVEVFSGHSRVGGLSKGLLGVHDFNSVGRWDASTGALIDIISLRNSAPQFHRIWSWPVLCDLTEPGVASFKRTSMIINNCENPAVEPQTIPVDSGFVAVAMNNRRRVVAVGSETGKIAIWKMGGSKQKLAEFASSLGDLQALALSGDGSRVVGYATANDGEYFVWDAVKGNLLGNGKLDPETGGVLEGEIAVSNDGESFAITGRSKSGHRQLGIASFSAFEKVKKTKLGQLAIRELSFSPDDSSLVALELEGGVISIENGKSLALKILIPAEAILGSSEPVTIGFVDKKRIFLSHNDGGVRVWDIAGGRLLATMFAFLDGSWITFDPAGHFISSGDISEKIRLVHNNVSYSALQFFDQLFRPDLVAKSLSGEKKAMDEQAVPMQSISRLFLSGRPPVVRMERASKSANTKETFVTKTERVTFSVELSDMGGGIGRVEWRVNGVTQKIENLGSEGRQIATASAELSMAGGNNRVSVVSYNRANNIQSETLDMLVDYLVPQQDKPRLFVLAVGVNAYELESLRLKHAVADANAVASAFKTDSLFSEVKVVTLTNAEVIKDRLSKEFAALRDRMHSNDVFIFYVAGHGKTLDGRYFFIPQDIRSVEQEEDIMDGAIGQEQLQLWLSNIKSQKTLVILDTCESGTVANQSLLSQLERSGATERLRQATGRSIFAAASATEVALEGYRGHGLFTYVLLEALAKGDSNGDELVDVWETATYIKRVLPLLSQTEFQHEQIPQTHIFGQQFSLAKH